MGRVVSARLRACSRELDELRQMIGMWEGMVPTHIEGFIRNMQEKNDVALGTADTPQEEA